MEIKVRCSTLYKEVTIVDGNTQVGLGLLNEQEQMELAKVFKNAISDLIPDYEECKAFLTAEE